MLDSITEVTETSWLSRIRESIKGVLFGLLLFVVSFPILWFNEKNSAETIEGLKQLARETASVESVSVDPAFEGRPVHMYGRAETDEVLRDSRFGVEANAIKLIREVEMYQWVEKEETKTQKKLGGGEEKVTTYHYEKVWSKNPINSGHFHEQGRAGHHNPPMPYQGETLQAKDVSLGAFKLSPFLVSQMKDRQPLALDDEQRNNLPPALRAKLQDDGLGYYQGNPLDPQIGDLRIEFHTVEPANVSIIAQQIGNTFGQFAAKNGKMFGLLEMGQQAKEGMIQMAQNRNRVFTWIMRLVGALVMFLGLILILRPFSVLADVVPLLGDIAEVGIGMFAGLIAVGGSMMTIAVAWVYYRPLVGIPLALLAVGVGVVIVMKLRQQRRLRQPINSLPLEPRRVSPEIPAAAATPRMISAEEKLKVSCPQCQQHLECDLGYAGLEVDCPSCAGKILIPSANVSAIAQGGFNPVEERLAGRTSENTPSSFLSKKSIPARLSKARLGRDAVFLGLVAVLFLGLIAAVGGVLMMVTGVVPKTWFGLSDQVKGDDPSTDVLAVAPASVVVGQTNPPLRREFMAAAPTGATGSSESPKEKPKSSLGTSVDGGAQALAKSLPIDGAQEWLQLSPIAWDTLKTFTVEAWVQSWQGILLNQGKGGDPENSLWLSFGPNGTSNPYDASGWESGRGDNKQFALGFPPSNRWVHVAMVFDGVNQAFYLDGIQKHRARAQGPGSIDPQHPLTIGIAAGPRNNVYRGRGQLRGVRVSASARYHSNFTPEDSWETDPQTLLLLEAGHQDDDVWVDLSGRGRDAQFRREARRMGTVRAAARPLQFDGKEDWLQLSPIPWDTLKSFTVEAWVLNWQDTILDQGAPGDPENSMSLRLGTQGPQEKKYPSGWEYEGGRNAVSYISPAPSNQWVHIAMVYDGATRAVFVNGKTEHKVRSPGPGPMRTDRSLTIGRGGQGMLRSLRVSTIARYRDNFQPSEHWSNDPQTILLLMAGHQVDRRWPDLSGQERHAQIHGDPGGLSN